MQRQKCTSYPRVSDLSKFSLLILEEVLFYYQARYHIPNGSIVDLTFCCEWDISSFLKFLRYLQQLRAIGRLICITKISIFLQLWLETIDEIYEIFNHTTPLWTSRNREKFVQCFFKAPYCGMVYAGHRLITSTVHDLTHHRDHDIPHQLVVILWPKVLVLGWWERSSSSASKPIDIPEIMPHCLCTKFRAPDEVNKSWWRQESLKASTPRSFQKCHILR